MPDYRLYRLDGAGQIAGAPEIVKAEDDAQAIAAARSRADAVACEIWRGGRLIARIPAA